MELPFEQGLAHYQLGLRTAADSAERENHLSLAIEIFEELGVLPELNLAKKALDVI